MKLFQNFRKRIDVNAFIDEITQTHEEEVDSEIAFESTIYGIDSENEYEDDELDSDLGEDENEPFTFIDNELDEEYGADNSVLESFGFDVDDEDILSDDLAEIEKSIYDDSLYDEDDDL